MPIMIIDEGERNVFEMEGSFFHYRRLSTKKKEELRKKHTKMKNGQEVTDFSGLMEDLLDHMIVGWENVLDFNKNEIECNRTNKLLLPDPVKATLISKVDILALDERNKQEEEIKN